MFYDMYIKREIQQSIKTKLENSNKIIIIYGPRQSGKTTLINEILKSLPGKKQLINADEKKYIDILSSCDLNKIKLLIEGNDILCIDEAQRIPDIGINLKIIHDNMPKLKIITSGSSSFDLANKIKEPLTGRTWTYTLYPMAVKELTDIYNKFELTNQLDELLIYGSYPEIFSIKNANDKYQYLHELSSSYLYKDILEISSIKYSFKIHDLLRVLAFQIGSEVSLKEIAAGLNMSKETVESYINLLEKSFVLFRLSGFNRNLRKEVTKMDKIFFYDLGIRNIIIDNLKPLSHRDDTGKLWENFIISERRKLLHNNLIQGNCYFWRTYTGAELDYIEEHENRLHGYEIKFNKRKEKPPLTWEQTYPDSSYKAISKQDYPEFLLNVDYK